MALQPSSIDPYLATLDESAERKVKESLASKLFGQAEVAVTSKSNGKSDSTFVHREDVVRAILMLANSDYAPGIYNVADDHPLTVHDAAAIINKAVGNVEKSPPQAQATIPPMLRRVMEATLVLDTNKIKRLGFTQVFKS